MYQSPDFAIKGAAPGRGRFGVLLRFWRRAFDLSQEDLAGLAEISVRHISFLENGRTMPSRHTVSAIASALGLGPRETSTMQMAAGHAPDFGSSDTTPDKDDLDRALILALRHADPLPAMVLERSGRILFVNKAWVALHRAYLGDLVEGHRLNALDLLLDARGWRRFLHDWVDLASIYLMLLAQDMLINPDRRNDGTIAGYVARPGVPQDWARRGARLSRSRPDYTLRMSGAGGASHVVRVMNTTIEIGPPHGHSALVLQTCYPESGGDILTAAQRLSLAGTSHPLCPY